MDEKKIRQIYKIIDEVFDDENLSDASKTKTLIKRRIRKILTEQMGKIIVENAVVRKPDCIYYIDGEGNLCEAKRGPKKKIKTEK